MGILGSFTRYMSNDGSGDQSGNNNNKQNDPAPASITTCKHCPIYAHSSQAHCGDCTRTGQAEYSSNGNNMIYCYRYRCDFNANDPCKIRSDAFYCYQAKQVITDFQFANYCTCKPTK